MDDMQPGQLIVPHNSDDPKPVGEDAPQPQRPEEEPRPDPDPAPPPAPIPDTTAVPPEPSLYRPEAQPVASQPLQSDPASTGQGAADDISWTAAEFVAHEKGAGWYALLIVIGLAIASVAYFLIKDLISTITIILAMIMLGVYAARKPKQQEYALNHQVIQVGMRTYSFHDYKNFSVAEEGDTASVVFMPLKRFMPPLTIYVAPGVEDQVVDFLANILPFEPHRADAIDSLLRRIHF